MIAVPLFQSPGLGAIAELARATLLHTGVEDTEIEIALERFRSDYYGRINR